MARTSDIDALLEAASEQGGYVSAAQAARLGVDGEAIRRLARAGDIRRVRRGVYALRHARHRLEDAVAAWLTLDRKRLPWERRNELMAAFSHGTAAGLYNLGTVTPRLPALTVPPRYRSISRARAIELHTAAILSEDWMWFLADDTLRVPATTPARTIVDLVAAGEEPSYVVRAIREALADDRASPDAIIAAAERRKQRSATLVRQVEALLPRSAA